MLLSQPTTSTPKGPKWFTNMPIVQAAIVFLLHHYSEIVPCVGASENDVAANKMLGGWRKR
ncbi:hypothetical protein TanjilG_10656 [Lupinus angustifolius]|nr:hypothetical protein TanjilG_10656 [Lupinus angustifolius]